MRPVEILEVREKSIAHRYGLKSGDRIISMNGKPLRDIIDYQVSAVEELVLLEVVQDGEAKTIAIENPSFGSLGIIFATSLFDGIKTCANKCVFCFVDQLPAGMRREVYIKDDDYRLSFLYGNFVTLTNARDEDIDRIIEDRLSPLYVSMHATNPELRSLLLGRKKRDKSFEHIKRLSDAGIELHVQMVMCPGLNDKDELDRSLDELSSGYSGISSVGIVPVGLTRYRDKAYPLRAFEKQEIIYLVEQVKKWQANF
ncbi:MAG TPA: DUF512 domain-containing protein, partial [Anaerolineae bacterium]|nr:DUF512 domain-containing protein [Anaerolineae bacterium]